MEDEDKSKPKDKDEKPDKRKEELIAEAIHRYDLAKLAFQKTFENSKTALDFRVLDQWPENIRKQRESDPDGARPCLVVDKLGQYVHQIVNDFRQQKTGIIVSPVDGGADIQVAEVYQDLIRRIENQSTASQAYNWAFQSAVESGLGYWRVITDYENEKSFNQEIYIKKVSDVFSVLFDPFASYSDGRDAEWCLIIEDYDKVAFEKTYGEHKGQFSQAEGTVDWVAENKIRVAEYFYKERVETEVGITAEGVTVELEKDDDRSAYTNTRPSKKTIVRWAKITNTSVLEEGIFPSKYLPIVRVTGDEHRVVNEGIFYQGMIYPALDAQRMYNYAASSFVETVALSPKAPFIAAAGQIENYRNEWSQANRRNFSVLQYDPVSINGTMAPPPQRVEMPGVPQGWSFVQQNMLQDVQTALGLFNSNLGQSSNERTGAAIAQRKTQGEHSQFHFFDNASMAIEQTGRIIVDMIPAVYDTMKVLKIRGEEGMIKQVFINPESASAVMQKIDEYNKIIGKEINPKIGSYDVVLESGPSSATKRQETSKAMFLLAQTSPELLRVGGDILVKNMDFPGSQELSERIKRTLPPEVINEGPMPDPEKEQMAQQIQMLSAENAELKKGHEFELTKQQMSDKAKLEQEGLTQQNENQRNQEKLQAQREIAMIIEAGKVKSARLTSKGEVVEDLVTNIGKYKSILIQQGYDPVQADSMLGTFSRVLKGEILKEVGVLDRDSKDDPLVDKIQDQEEEKYLDEF